MQRDRLEGSNGISHTIDFKFSYISEYIICWMLLDDMISALIFVCLFPKEPGSSLLGIIETYFEEIEIGYLFENHFDPTNVFPMAQC